MWNRSGTGINDHGSMEGSLFFKDGIDLMAGRFPIDEKNTFVPGFFEIVEGDVK